jgi:putative ABC transport system permease protein
MRLALRNIVHDRLRFLLGIGGIAFSAFLMIFQGSLLAGFERAASRVIDSIDGDIWIMPRGVQALDFAPPMRAGYWGIVRGIAGVSSVREVAAGLAFWQRPDGTRKTIVVVGTERTLPGEAAAQEFGLLKPESVIVDASDFHTLGLTELPVEIEINSHRRRVEGMVSGYGSFLGSPYVFGNLTDARKTLGMGAEGAMFLVLRVEGRSLPATQAELRDRLPELDVLNKNEFSSRAKWYWTMETGAGGALLTAALLGFVVGVLIVSQIVYATTMENIEEFATLKALGASHAFVIRIVVTQALISALVGCAVGMTISIPVTSMARQFIAWVYTPWELFLALTAATVLLAALASTMAVRAALGVEPGRVFRA